MLSNNFEVHYFHFSHRQKSYVPPSSQVRKTNVNKKRPFLALGEDFFPLFLLAAATSSLLDWTANFTTLLTLLTSALPVLDWLVLIGFLPSSTNCFRREHFVIIDTGNYRSGAHAVIHSNQQ